MEEIIIELNKDKKVTNEKYSRPGVWALWAKNKSGNNICLEVGQTSNMLKEINQDIEILRLDDDSDKCINCIVKYDARTRYQHSAEFKIHKCKQCKDPEKIKNISTLRKRYALNGPRRVDKYKEIGRAHV